MTVKELIEKLQEPGVNPDAEICVCSFHQYDEPAKEIHVESKKVVLYGGE